MDVFTCLCNGERHFTKGCRPEFKISEGKFINYDSEKIIYPNEDGFNFDPPDRDRNLRREDFILDREDDLKDDGEEVEDDDE